MGKVLTLATKKGIDIDLVDAMMSSLIASECHSTSLDAKEARALSLNARLFGLVSLWKEWRQRTNSA